MPKTNDQSKPAQSLITGCMVCGSMNNLNRCSGCRTVQYCGRDHQTSHWTTHKPLCNKIKKSFTKFKKEETKLRNYSGDDGMMPENPLENPDAVGHFWGIFETRDYMAARYDWVYHGLKTKTRYAVATAVENLEDMFRLCRGDNMGLRWTAPHLYLRLGRDQQCYDFCKFWRNIFYDSKYNSHDMNAPFLNLKDENVFEPVDLFIGKYPDISSLAAVTLIKIRLMIDLQALQRTRQELGQSDPQRVLDAYREHAVSSVITGNQEILESEDHTARISELKKQIKLCIDGTNKANKYFWPAMLKPGNYLTTMAGPYIAGSEEEMVVMLQYSYDAFAETPGAIEVIKELSK